MGSVGRLGLAAGCWKPVSYTHLFMDAPTVAGYIRRWAAQYDPEFSALLESDPVYAEGIFAIDRGGSKPRKDIAKWSDAKEYAAYFYDSLYQRAFDLPENIAPADATAILEAYAAVYDPTLDKQAWFDAVKAMCPSLGFCPEVKEYKKNPEGYKGHAGDVSTVLRIAVTGRRNTPDPVSYTHLADLDFQRRQIMLGIVGVGKLEHHGKMLVVGVIGPRDNPFDAFRRHLRQRGFLRDEFIGIRRLVLTARRKFDRHHNPYRCV